MAIAPPVDARIFGRPLVLNYDGKDRLRRRTLELQRVVDVE